MSMHEAAEQSACSAKGFSSKCDEAVLTHKQNSVDFLIVTRIPQKTYNFQWIIRQFSTLSINKELHSTNIHASDKSRYRLKLVKHGRGFCLFHVDEKQSKETSAVERQKTTHGNKNQSINCFSVSTVSAVLKEPNQVSNSIDFNLKLDYLVSALDSRGKELAKWSVCFSDDSEVRSCKIGEYTNNTLEIFPDDSLMLNCKLKIISMPVTEEIPITSKLSLGCNNWKKLSSDMKALYQNSVDTDVTLVVGTEKIRAHKVILMARSAVFRKIFHHDMEEAEQNTVIITDVPLSALHKVVDFLYTGFIVECENKDMNLQELFDLYYAADKYEVMDLREMVGNTLLGRIQVDNASEILVCADRHNDLDLKFRVMHFIRQNFEGVLNTDTWESCALHDPKLAVEIISFCSKKHKGCEKKV